MEDAIDDEMMISTSPSPVSIGGMKKILEQMRYSICKITFEDQKAFGTGFFCNINYQGEIIPAFFTNYHLINENNLNKFIITFKNNKIIYKNIDIINEKSRKYFDKKLDVTIIELNNIEKKLEKIKFLEIDDNLFSLNSEDGYNNRSIYIPQYPKGSEALVSFGLIEAIKNPSFFHECSTEKGCSGSPILDIKSQKLIGIHRGAKKDKTGNVGSFLKKAIQGFFEENKIPKKELINKINIKVEVDYKDIGEKTYFLGSSKNLKDKVKILEDLNDSNAKIFINEEKYYYAKYFIPNKQGIYDINIELTNIIQDCSYMFSNCENITYIDLSSFNSKSVKNTEYMFYRCMKLEKINLINFETRYISKMNNMFDSCLNLKEIDLSKFDTRNVEDMGYMFFNCKNLKSIDLKSFNTKNVINMCYMFANCYNIEKINFSSFNTEKVEDMEFMFYECKNFKNIDLSSFNTCRNINMDTFITHYNKIKRIKLKKNFNTIIRNIVKKYKNIKVIEVD